MNSLTINVEIMRVKSIGMDIKQSYTSRKNSIDQLCRLPHRDKNIHIMDCLLAIISDDKIQIEHRYSLFNENRSLDNEVRRKCHMFYFNNFNPPLYPIRLKLMSAQYLLQSSDRDSFDLIEVYGFLIRTSRCPSTNNNIKAECADILSRCGYSETAQQILDGLAMPVLINQYIENRRRIEPRIENLPEARRRILVKRRTVYDDGQNVHNTSINEGVKEIIRELHKEHNSSIQPSTRITNLNEVSKRIVYLSKEKSLVVRKKITGTIDRIMIDPTLFECEVNMCDILIMVWMKIKSSIHKEELEKRLIEEMEEMNGLCATGHISRLINILSGFFDNMSVKISFKDQLKNYVYNFYNKILGSMTDDISEKIIDEMTESDIDKKETLMKMVNDNNNKEILKREFSNINTEEFEDWYNSSIKSYCGLEN